MWFLVKHISHFFRIGMATDISLISRSTCSSATFTDAVVALVPVLVPLFAGPLSMRRRFWSGSDAPWS
jgi:hypothetical protein